MTNKMWWAKHREIVRELTEVLETGDNYIWYVDAGAKYLEVFEDGDVVSYFCADREDLYSLLELF